MPPINPEDGHTLPVLGLNSVPALLPGLRRCCIQGFSLPLSELRALTTLGPQLLELQLGGTNGKPLDVETLLPVLHTMPKLQRLGLAHAAGITDLWVGALLALKPATSSSGGGGVGPGPGSTSGTGVSGPGTGPVVGQTASLKFRKLRWLQLGGLPLARPGVPMAPLGRSGGSGPAALGLVKAPASAPGGCASKPVVGPKSALGALPSAVGSVSAVGSLSTGGAAPPPCPTLTDKGVASLAAVAGLKQLQLLQMPTVTLSGLRALGSGSKSLEDVIIGDGCTLIAGASQEARDSVVNGLGWRIQLVVCERLTV